MFDEIVADVEQWLSRREGPLVIGVSGGPDSLALLHLLARYPNGVVVAHLDHGLRQDSGADYRYVKELARQYQAPFYGRHERAGDYAVKEGKSLEEAGRDLRYQFLFDTAHQLGAAGVAVGHNADDQVETVLMHFLRGAGTRGLQGMQVYSLPNPWSSEIPLLRPLLGTWRKEIESYCIRHQLQPLFDHTNLDLNFTRNRLRAELIPDLETYNPQVKAAIMRSSRVLQAESELLQPIYQRAWSASVVWESPVDIRIQQLALKESPLAVQRFVIKQALQKLIDPQAEVSFDWIERVLDFLQAEQGVKSIEPGGGLRVYTNQGQIWIYRQDAQTELGGLPLLAESEEIKLPLPGAVMLQTGWTLQARWTKLTQEKKEEIFQNPDPYQCWLQIPEKIEHLLLRSRETGDRFSPLGMGGHSMKLADYMTNEFIPEPMRDRWVLVVINHDIAWVAGHTIAHHFRVQEEKSPILHLRLAPEGVDRGGESV